MCISKVIIISFNSTIIKIFEFKNFFPLKTSFLLFASFSLPLNFFHFFFTTFFFLKCRFIYQKISLYSLLLFVYGIWEEKKPEFSFFFLFNFLCLLFRLRNEWSIVLKRRSIWHISFFIFDINFIFKTFKKEIRGIFFIVLKVYTKKYRVWFFWSSCKKNELKSKWLDSSLSRLSYVKSIKSV